MKISYMKKNAVILFSLDKVATMHLFVFSVAIEGVDCSIIEAGEKLIWVLVRIFAPIPCNSDRSHQVSWPYSQTILRAFTHC